MAAAYGLPTTVRGVRAFISFYPQRRIGSAGASIVTECHHVRNWHFADVQRTAPHVSFVPTADVARSIEPTPVGSSLN